MEYLDRNKRRYCQCYHLYNKTKRGEIDRGNIRFAMIITVRSRRLKAWWNSAFEISLVLLLQVAIHVLVPLQRLRCSGKQDVHHWASIWPRQWGPLHLPSGRTQPDPRRLWPRLQHVLGYSCKPHQKPLPVLPHEGKISVAVLFIDMLKITSLNIADHSCILIRVSFGFCFAFVAFNCQTFLEVWDKWVFDQRMISWPVWISCQREFQFGIDTFYLPKKSRPA